MTASRAVLLAALLCACGGSNATVPTAPPAAPAVAVVAAKPAPVERAVRLLPLGKYGEPMNEFSGMDWWGDTLVILPQYPERLGGVLLAVERDDIEDFLDAKRADLPMRSLRFHDRNIWKRIAKVRPNTTYEGYEAIAFDEGEVFLALEASRTGDGAGTLGYLVTGRVDLKRGITLSGEFTELPVQTPIKNMGYEALLVRGREVVAIHELNDGNNGSRQVWVYDRVTKLAEPRAMDLLEYRVTDATADADTGAAWALNYHWPGSPWTPGRDGMTEKFGVGATHAGSKAVERIVTLRVDDAGVGVAEDVPPIQLELGSGDSRNWEGLARLPGRGFLLVTDRHPGSLLGFVAE